MQQKKHVPAWSSKYLHEPNLNMSADTQLEVILNSVNLYPCCPSTSHSHFFAGVAVCWTPGVLLTIYFVWLCYQVLKEVCMRGDFIHAEALK
jgi:hypothetical protein